jgi:hypothetical protein
MMEPFKVNIWLKRWQGLLGTRHNLRAGMKIVAGPTLEGHIGIRIGEVCQATVWSILTNVLRPHREDAGIRGGDQRPLRSEDGGPLRWDEGRKLQ